MIVGVGLVKVGGREVFEGSLNWGRWPAADYFEKRRERLLQNGIWEDGFRRWQRKCIYMFVMTNVCLKVKMRLERPTKFCICVQLIQGLGSVWPFGMLDPSTCRACLKGGYRNFFYSFIGPLGHNIWGENVETARSDLKMVQN